MTHSVPLVCLAGESSLCLGRLPAFEQHRAEASAEPAWGTGGRQSLGEEPGEVQGGHSEWFLVEAVQILGRFIQNWPIWP